MFFCTLLNVQSSFANILIGKRELVTLLGFLVFCGCCVALSHGAMGLQFLIVVFPDHTHYFSLKGQCLQSQVGNHFMF